MVCTFTYGGDWFGESEGVGSSGYYWSSVVYFWDDDVYSYYFSFGMGGDLDPQVYGGRDYGFSVRCVAR